MASNQRKTRKQKQNQKKVKHGGYVWNTKSRRAKSSTLRPRSSSNKKMKSKYSVLPNVIY